MEAERRYLGVLKGLLIVLVVVGHFGQTIANNLPSTYGFIAQGIILFIYLFHMPLFLMVSGYLSKNEEKRRAKAFGDLFIPYVLFQVFVGICLLIITRSGEALQDIFIPQMGAWYLLALFIYRLILPEVKRVRGILAVGFLLTIFTCMSSVGSEFALRKTLGFFLYFLLGYKMPSMMIRKIPKWLARISLLVVLLGIILISRFVDWYAITLSVLSRNAGMESFARWYYAPGAYFLAFLGTLLVSFLFLNAIPEKCDWLEKQGLDTMPTYLSHLILFMGLGYVLNKNNWIVTVLISLLFMLAAIWIFSRNWYRKIFNSTLNGIKRFILKEKID